MRATEKAILAAQVDDVFMELKRNMTEKVNHCDKIIELLEECISAKNDQTKTEAIDKNITNLLNERSSYQDYWSSEVSKINIAITDLIPRPTNDMPPPGPEPSAIPSER